MRHIFSALLVLVVISETRGGIVTTVVSPINGHTYHLLTPSTWTEAEAEARSLGGHLATVRSAEEDEWIWNTFGDPTWQWPDPLRMLWIGLNDAETDGEFHWSSGESVTYTNWARNQPSGYNGDIKEDYVQMGYIEEGSPLWQWNDLHDIAYTDSEPVQTLQGVVEVTGDGSVPGPSGSVGLASLIAAGLLGYVWRRHRTAG